MQSILNRLRKRERISKEELEERFSNGEDIGVLCLYARECHTVVIGVSDLANVHEFWRNKIVQNTKDLIAQNYLGDCLRFGIGTEFNLKEAANLYKIAAEGGNPVALNNYGCCFETGLGVDKSLQTAIGYYESSTDQGNSNAQANLARLLLSSNSQRAIELCELSASQNNPHGRHWFGHCLLNGIGIDKNPTRAIEQCVLALSCNYPGGASNSFSTLTKLLQGQDRDVARSAQEAIDRLVKSKNASVKYYYAIYLRSKPNPDLPKVIKLLKGAISNTKYGEITEKSLSVLEYFALHESAVIQQNAIQAIRRLIENGNSAAQNCLNRIIEIQFQNAIGCLNNSNPNLQYVIDSFALTTNNFADSEMNQRMLNSLADLALRRSGDARLNAEQVIQILREREISGAQDYLNAIQARRVRDNQIASEGSTEVPEPTETNLQVVPLLEPPIVPTQSSQKSDTESFITTSDIKSFIPICFIASALFLGLGLLFSPQIGILHFSTDEIAAPLKTLSLSLFIAGGVFLLIAICSAVINHIRNNKNKPARIIHEGETIESPEITTN